jgi:1,2-diacylglycerol 3-beta-glucosyltransferase
MSALVFLLVSVQSALTLTGAYLLGLLVAARSVSPERGDGTASPGEARAAKLAVIVPAYNEEDGIAATIESLCACEGSEHARVIVLADNCTDDTAARAVAAGAEVWERDEPDRRGKGYALAAAFQRLFAPGEELDGVVVVDADCTVSPNFFTAVSSRLARGTQALQVDYLAANPADSSISALRFAAFAVGDTVRFRGKEGIGHSCGLVGTGMAFSPALLKEVPWTVTGLVEDGEYHMRLVQAGARAEFVPEAWVSQAVPTSLKASSDQQARWEMGKAQLARRWAPQLVASGLRRTDSVRLHAGLECLVPPQSVLALGNGFGLLAGLALRSRRLLGLSLLGTLAQATFVIGGLRLVNAPACVYRALLSAPVLIANKLALYARIVLGKGPSGWVRTERGG